MIVLFHLEPDEPVAPSSLMERLATQVVKNLQINIEKIHIRYEDKYIQPYRPAFAAGVTLESLQFVVRVLHEISVSLTSAYGFRRQTRTSSTRSTRRQ
jgi:Vacuolar sorting-associated protein 13, N-terminal